MARMAAVWISLALLGVCRLTGQQSKPTFEVVSVKAQHEPFSFANMATASPRVRQGGLFTASHATVASLILFAYDLQSFQLAGGPEWARGEYFDISAKPSSDVPVEQVKLMVQSLLADRFKLTSHTEQRGMKFLALILARPDGRLGPYIQQMGDDCTATSASEVVKKFPPRAATTSDGMMSGRCANITALAGLLGVEMEMPVVDQTGLSGKFVYEILGVTPNNSRVRIPPDSVPKWPSVPVALEEQLGLKLESRRGPFPVFIIDSVQQPIEN